MATADGLVLSLLVVMHISRAASAPPIATPKPPVPVQISSITSEGVFRVMRKDLVFQPPDSFLYVLRQLWRDTSKGSVVSLQIYNPDTEQASAADVNPRLFLTRDVIQPQSYSPAQTFLPFDIDNRLLQLKCCGCGNGEAPVTFYWPQGASSSTFGYFTVSSVDDPSANDLTLSRGTTTAEVFCGLSNMKIRQFPQVVPSTGASRKRRSTTSAKVQMIAHFGNDTFFVGVKRSSDGGFVLSVLPSRKKLCYRETAFYYEGYEEYHVGLDGNITSRSSFTLQHLATGLYLVADVLDTIALNTGQNFTGIKLQNSTYFEPNTPEFPDYRFFVRYDLDYYGSFIHLLCPLYHRRFCMVPTNSGNVRVAPVALSDQRPWPTLVDPLDFGELLGRLNENGTIPTFDFIPIPPIGY